MPLFPLTENVLSVLDSPEGEAIGSAFGIGVELTGMLTALSDVQEKLQQMKGALGGADFFLFGTPLIHWDRLKEAVFDAEFLLDELSTQLALFRSMGRHTLSGRIGLFFSRRNPFRLRSRIKQINEGLGDFAREPLDFNEGAWKQRSNYLVAALQGPERGFFDLPLRLKHCFAYCLLFPENYVIDRSTLTQLWMAQGLVPSADANNDSGGEDVGSAYVVNLCRRSLLSEVQEDEFGNIASFKVHNLVYKYLRAIVWPEYSTLFFCQECFHLSASEVRFDQQGRIIASAIFDVPRLRTFLIPYQPKLVNLIYDHGWKYEWFIQTSPCLRALDLHRTHITNVPWSVDKLKHLRYLDLSGNACIETLPRFITTLWNLQTLKLSFCERLKELPDDMEKLVNLRHLEIDGCWGLTHMPSGLSELEGLHQLRGRLELRGLEKVKDASVEVKAANIKSKKYLDTLTLVWEVREAVGDDDAAARTYRDDKMTLQTLEPNLNLKGLCINGYGGAKFPTWLSSLIHLVKITLSNCYQCRYLPPLDQLFVLKHLMLEKLSALEFIIGNDPSSSFRRPRVATYFPSLEQLCLRELPNLKGWFEEDMITDWEDGMYQQEHLPTSFSVLSAVTIDDCPELSMSLLPRVRSLRVNKAGKNQLQCFLQPSLPWLAQSGSSSSMSNIMRADLKSLCLSYMRDLDHLPETYFSKLSSLEDVEIQHCPNLVGLPPLKSLKRLTILGCQRLTSLSGWINHLTALENLKLHRCPELDLSLYRCHSKIEDIVLRWWPEFEMSLSSDTGEQKLDSSSASDDSDGSGLWGKLQRLTSLEIVDIPKLAFLPGGLRLVTSLQKLELTACSALEELPEWISEFQFLRRLNLSFCPNLKSLPKGLARLKDLSGLNIIGCPHLKRRYKKETGTDWKDIAHVGDVEGC
ncbi:putative disease resistance protein RGA1 isoform X2 [Punica granatum]|uniref:Disease resistance protein RGA1 isoform X2 n=1 Tax=Punica granatum TaxID=22663 RepID=A0A6P8BY66_PUNGR|nr:putative disease resistance protein RGA1 isoform X2 [Punica granatum]